MGETWKSAETWSLNLSAGGVYEKQFKGSLFDSILGKNSHPTQNHRLSLILRLYLKPVSGKNKYKDLNERDFPVKEWTANEWYNFTTVFERQTHLWNNRFWLIPPKYFSLLDAKYNNRAMRPNVHCHLLTEILNSPSGAHRTIDVVNLDVEKIKRQNGGKKLDSRTFRSDENTYDSLDITPRTNRYKDDRNVEHTIKNYFTIAHEIGHALGLDHVGVLRSRPYCVFAVSLASHGVKDVSEHLEGGGNSKACYGRSDSPSIAENIMGLGTKFEAINAQPWLSRVAMHTNTSAPDWKVSLAPASPSVVI
jgi:hypothetical protein